MISNREHFVESVRRRDGKCVMCRKDGTAVHHIIERKLWDDGGYHQDNGAFLCDECHWDAERTIITTDEIRKAAGIENVSLPHGFDPCLRYDKWGNTIIDERTRIPGPLHGSDGEAAALRNLPLIFTQRVKYPKTMHFPWSPNLQNDDRMLESLEGFEGEEIVITEKMDGENTTMYNDGIHARSLDSGHHPSRAWVKDLHGRIALDIPEGWRVCGENMYAVHSIQYHSLSSYFLVFGIWNRDICLSWDDVTEWSLLLGLDVVPVLHRGQWDEGLVKDMVTPEGCEGYVVRVTREFRLSEFPSVVGKYVRRDHVRSDDLWMYQEIKKNGLISTGNENSPDYC